MLIKLPLFNLSKCNVRNKTMAQQTQLCRGVHSNSLKRRGVLEPRIRMVPVSSLQCSKAITESSPYSETLTDHLGTKDMLTNLAKCRACRVSPHHWITGDGSFLPFIRVVCPSCTTCHASLCQPLYPLHRSPSSERPFLIILFKKVPIVILPQNQNGIEIF